MTDRLVDAEGARMNRKTDMNVTLKHIVRACHWARTAGEKPKSLDGTVREYYQGTWDCGTACCIWGAAYLMANSKPAKQGPGPRWCDQSHLHDELSDLLAEPDTTPQDILDHINKTKNSAKKIVKELTFI